jgi:MarR family 2-MHQ and catechol resistance regulon transcriptional repressor
MARPGNPAERGLGMTKFAVLEVLYHKGALPLGEIRDRILVAGPSTTYVVKKLEKRGCGPGQIPQRV